MAEEPAERGQCEGKGHDRQLQPSDSKRRESDHGRCRRPHQPACHQTERNTPHLRADADGSHRSDRGERDLPEREMTGQAGEKADRNTNDRQSENGRDHKRRLVRDPQRYQRSEDGDDRTDDPAKVSKDPNIEVRIGQPLVADEPIPSFLLLATATYM